MSTRLEQRTIAKTADYTISPANGDRPGTHFTNVGAGGAVVFTLPTPTAALIGYWYRFSAHANQSLTVSCTGALVAPGNAAANTAGFTTAGAKLGRVLSVYCDGTRWFVTPDGVSGFGVNGTEVQDTIGGVAVTATAAEINRLAGVTAGTATASKVLVAGTNKNLDVLAVADLKLGAGAGTSVTATAAQLNSVGTNIGAAAGTGVTAAETGFGRYKTTILTFVNTPVPLSDEAGVVAYGGLKVYDFPQGYIYIQSAVADLAITKSSAGVNDNWDGDIGVGTVTATNDGTLASTEQNIIPTTSTPQAVAGATTGDCVSTATEHAIHDGTTTAVDLFVNLLVDDADHNVAGTPCNLILNGTLAINWIFMGDN